LDVVTVKRLATPVLAKPGIAATLNMDAIAT
jgi:hypothetical protein